MPSSLDSLAEFAGACEAGGFSGIGIHDHPETGLDAYVAAAAVAARTSRLEVYVAVTNIVSRHPLVLASIAGSLAQLAPGRFRMVVGAGNVGVRQIGRSPAGLQELGSGVRAMRSLIRGDSVLFGNGSPTALRSVPEPAPSIMIACAGPRGLDRALGDADGAFLLAGLDRTVNELIRDRIGQRHDFELIRVVPVHVTRTLAEGRRWFAGWWASLASSPHSSDRWIGRSVEHWWRQARPSTAGGDAGSAGVNLDSLAEWVGLFGPAAYCHDRLARLHADGGVTRVYLWNAHLAERTEGIPDAYEFPQRELDELGPFLEGLRAMPG